MYSFSIHSSIPEDYILPFADYFVSSDEKTANHEIISVRLPFHSCNIRLHCVGNNELLKEILPSIIALQELEKLSSKKRCFHYCKLINALNITVHRSTARSHSKLNGINSISTCCLLNPYCRERIKNHVSVCSHCYAKNQTSYQKSLQDRLIINTLILCNVSIPAHYFKLYFPREMLTRFTRIESFGDVPNETCAINYINLCSAFPLVHFAAWTKNSGIWHFAIMKTNKPKNLVITHSSLILNKPELYVKQTYNFIDHVFTVYDKNFITKNNVKINCGGRSCMDCIKRKRNCYFRNTDIEINEQLK